MTIEDTHAEADKLIADYQMCKTRTTQTAGHTRPGGKGREVVIQGDEGRPAGERTVVLTAGHTRPGGKEIEVARNMPTAVRPEFRDIDLRDVEHVDEFCRTGCGCALSCSARFPLKHYLATDSQQLVRRELDMVLMGHLHSVARYLRTVQSTDTNPNRGRVILLFSITMVCTCARIHSSMTSVISGWELLVSTTSLKGLSLASTATLVALLPMH